MVDALRINADISIPIDEVEFRPIRSRGAGGQNVNKVATAIQLRFDAKHSPHIPAAVKARLMSLGDQRVSRDGVIVIKAQESRSQARNRAAALTRLGDLLSEASQEEPPRIPTRPGKHVKIRRVDEKRHRGKVKELRGRIRDD